MSFLGADILDSIQKKIDRIQTITIGVIESYDPDNLRADVRLNWKKTATAPIITHCPVMVTNAGGLVIIPPYERGNMVMVGMTREEAETLAQDGEAREAKATKHRLENACVLGGIFSNVENVEMDGSSDAWRLGTTNGAVILEIDSNTVRIVSGNVELGEGNMEALIQDTMAGALNAHTHTVLSGSSAGVTSGPNDPIHTTDDSTEDVSAS